MKVIKNWQMKAVRLSLCAQGITGKPTCAKQRQQVFRKQLNPNFQVRSQHYQRRYTLGGTKGTEDTAEA